MVKCEVCGNRVRLTIMFLVLTLLIITVFSGLDIWEASAASDAASDIEVNVDPWIRVTIPTDTVTLDLNPTTEADFDSANLAVTVATNNEPGYTLTMSPSDNITTNLTRKNGTETIPTLTELSGGYTEQAFTTNTWGYKLSTTNYLPFATNNEIGSNDTLTAGDTNTVTFASKIDGSVLDGTYELEITFTVVGNIELAPSMQDLTLAQCPTNEPLTVRDIRDNQEYKVQKLADRKCWMVENLNLAGGTALSASDTDVTSAYISSFSTSNNLTKTGDTIVLPASDNSSSSFKTSNYSYVYNTGNKTCDYAEPGCYSYYSWDAATLGSGRALATDNIDAEQSICPKGWRLPTSGADYDNGWKRGDFYTLATAYGADLESSASDSSATFYNNAGPGTTPNFLPVGYYDYGFFYGSGTGALYWSSSAFWDSSNARYLEFTSSYVHPAAGAIERRAGFGVRCLMNSPYVTVSMDGNTSSVLFSDGTNTQIATPANPTVSLANNTQYTIAASFASGYEFANWVTDSNATIGSVITNPTTFSVTGVSTLHVVSQLEQAHTIADGGNMQDVSSVADGGCPITLTTGQAYTLTDNRGTTPQTYNVARLADGKCWMLDNLALGGPSAIALTSADTNIIANWTLPASGTANFAMDSISYTTAAINTDSKDTIVTSYGSGSGKVGVYYNYCAVSAGTYCYASDAGVGNAEHDICPSGWRMPSGDANGEYQALFTAYNSNVASFKNALSSSLSGYFMEGSAYDQGNMAYFWSSTVNSRWSMYDLYVDSSSVNQGATYRPSGLSVRCVLK